MDSSSILMDFRQTGYFNEIVTDYVSGNNDLRPFFEHNVNDQGLVDAIRAREAAPVNRDALVKVLQEQYASLEASSGQDHVSPAALDRVKANIEKLGSANTFTVCTAHQPNIFSGYLYFIYKTIHAIRLAERLQELHPYLQFVPVFYIGTEDADLEELGKIFLGGEKLVWNTSQKGAVGRMKTKGLEQLVNRIEGELSVQPHGKELMALIRTCYLESPDVQTATFRLLHNLFAEYGLVVLIPDHPLLKREMSRVFEDDLFHHTASRVVASTNAKLGEKYKVQANPREINVFYLKDDIRNRIEKQGDGFFVVDTAISFTADEMKREIVEHPERFSPNVILRGLYQETILPNIAFIGGGGELAYWLELKELFHHYKVPYPVQVLRNSMLLVEKKWEEKIHGLGFSITDFFQTEQTLLDELVKRDSAAQVHLTNEIRDTRAFYDHLRKISGNIDKTLETHVNALEAKMLKQLKGLEKKLLRAEKRKFSDQSGQIRTIRAAIFPNGGLQERVENFMPWYARYGRDIIRKIYDNSLTIEQKFVIISV